MRLFIASRFDDNILDALSDYQDDLRALGIAGNYTRRENLHITLAFIGEYGTPDAVLDAMESVDFEPVNVRLNGIGAFRDLFWVGIEDNPELAEYVKHLRRELASRGIPYDRKRFSPHITLVRKFKNPHRVVLPEAVIPQSRISRISLMRSDRGKHGMIYTEIGAVIEYDQPVFKKT